MSATVYALQRGMPAALETERSILGAILLHEKLYDQASALNHNDFSLDAHRRIFARIAAMASIGTPLDMVTLSEELDRRKELEAAGGVAYLSSLIDGVVDRPSIEQYVKIVKDRARRRELINAVQSASAEAIESAEETDSVMSKLEARIATIRADVTTDPFRSYAELTPDTYNEMLQRNDRRPRLTYDIPDLDEATTGICDEELVIIGGDPGSGKSAFASQIAAANGKFGKRIGIFSVEMRSKRILRRAWSSELEMSFSKLKRPWTMTSTERERLTATVNSVAEWPIWINDLSRQTPESFLSQAKMAVLKHKLELIIVDHIHLMDSRGKDDVERIKNISGALRAFAKDYCPVIALSQLSRPERAARSLPPTMRDLKGSSALEQDASVIILLWRQKEGDNAGQDQMIIGKNRDGEVRNVPVVFLGDFLRYVPRDWQQ